MVGAIADWPQLFRQIRQNLKPGGLVEFQEYEGWIFSYKDISKTNISEWQRLVNEATVKFGKELDVAGRIKQLMIECGLEDVTERVVQVSSGVTALCAMSRLTICEQIPIGPWAKGKKNKEIGMFQREHICDCVDAYTIGLFTRIYGWSVDECRVMMSKVKNEVRDPQHQLYANFYFIYGKAPMV